MALYLSLSRHWQTCASDTPPGSQCVFHATFSEFLHTKQLTQPSSDMSFVCHSPRRRRSTHPSLLAALSHSLLLDSPPDVINLFRTRKQQSKGKGGFQPLPASVAEKRISRWLNGYPETEIVSNKISTIDNRKVGIEQLCGQFQVQFFTK